MHKKFNHEEMEKKWQHAWEESGDYNIGERDLSKEKEYVLVEWPYPSGNLHIGHWFAFAVVDIYVRARRMQGKQVLFPMGFDAFGLPAENAAIKRSLDPKDWTDANMAHMREQLKSMGNAFSWDMTTNSTDEEYYAWTQWMFTKLFENDIAFRGDAVVNWCPGCNTVIANEQVLVDGTCERSGDVIERRDMKQWMLRITKYADRLIDDLDVLDWPEHIKESQKQWIGRSEGAEFDFKLSTGDSVTIFTTRPDTLYGATYVVLAPEHDLVHQNKENISNWAEVEAYIQEASQKDEILRTKAEKEKTGVKLEGITATNPATGEQIPVFIADYVLKGYGTGAIMAVPAHDERDFSFAKKYGLPIKQVIAKKTLYRSYVMGISDKSIFTDSQISIIHEADDGDIVVEIPTEKIELFEKLIVDNLKPGFWNEYVGEKTVFIFKHKDDRLERIVLSDKTEATIDKLASEFMNEHSWNKTCVWKWLSENKWYSDLIIHSELGTLVNSAEFDGMNSEEAKVAITEKFGGEMKSTYRLRDWSIGRQRYWGVPIPIVYDPEGKPHTIPKEHLPWNLPTDVDFKPTGEAPLAKSAELKKRVEDIFGSGWTPEVETMDTFVDSSWYFFRYFDAHNVNSLSSLEKQKQWMPIDIYFGGSEHNTMHLLYSRFWTKVLYDLGLSIVDEPYKKRINRGLVLGPDGNKMSKSKGNVIDPDEQVKRLGADTVKMYLAFMGPYGEMANYPWDMGGIVGLRRFLERVYGLSEHIGDAEDAETTRLIHKTIQKVTTDIELYKFNTAISALMVFLNHAEKSGLTKQSYLLLLRLLAPFAPHMAEELWYARGETTSVHSEAWPTADTSLTSSATVTLSVQVNGKMRGTIAVPTDSDETTVLQALREDTSLASRIPSEPTRVIHIKNKIINIIG
ncbi:MAG: leucine--tRNA ligase [Candidatus Kaiserbacteria bacterium]|nr:leucine--tRNA ligase [Candidatus Kaiserbacteria bacterium]